MYIIKKTISGKEYYYIRESVREGDKVKSKLIGYGGKTIELANKKLEEFKMQKENEKNKEFKSEEKEIESNLVENIGVERDKNLTIDELANFCKQKGFVFRSSDVYGGLAGFWDFGPIGVELFNNIKQSWWNYFVKQRNDIAGIEASIISHPLTWKASGHLANFSDISVVCKKCGKSNKIDKSEVGKVKCECGGEYEVKGEFNLMFKTSIGATNPTTAYLRGETAQGMFMDFKLIQQTTRMQLPFGIAQIGKCFRNEIAPRDFLFRSREFHIGEFEFFINPNEEKCSLLSNAQLNVKFMFLDAESQKSGIDKLKETNIEDILKKGKLDEWHAYWLAEQIKWFRSLGLTEIKIREHTKDELSHYSSATFDIDYEYPFGSKEVAGIANRGQYDLNQHQKESKESMEIFDEKYKNKIIPRVIEPTFGMERVFLAVLTKAYNFDEKRQNVVLKIPASLAPIKAAVFPIVKDETYEKIAEDIVNDLKKQFNVVYDKSGSIGRRYARNDEIGTPMCITIDEESEKTKRVTLRDRDTTKQISVKISELRNIIQKVIDGENILKLGEIVETRVKKDE